MKFMISTYGSQKDYDAMAGRPQEDPVWTREDFVAMARFMGELNSELAESGELVAAQQATSLPQKRYLHAQAARLENE